MGREHWKRGSIENFGTPSVGQFDFQSAKFERISLSNFVRNWLTGGIVYSGPSCKIEDCIV